MKEYSGVAREEGITRKEIGAAMSVAMAVSGCRVRAQFKRACAHDLAESKQRRSGEESGRGG